MEELEQRGTQRDVHMFSSTLFVMENVHRGPLLAAVHRICCVPPSPSLTTSRSCCVAGVLLQATIPHFFAWPGSSHPKKAAGAGPHHLMK